MYPSRGEQYWGYYSASGVIGFSAGANLAIRALNAAKVKYEARCYDFTEHGGTIQAAPARFSLFNLRSLVFLDIDTACFKCYNACIQRSIAQVFGAEDGTKDSIVTASVLL